MLNCSWEKEIGSLEKGKFAAIIAIADHPLADVTEMERVQRAIRQ